MEVLKRPVQLDVANWVPGRGLVIRTNPLLDLVATSYPHRTILGAINGIPTDMGMYRYLRCGFKMTVKVNSTPYHQGVLVASWRPPGLGTINELPQHTCAWNAVMLSASQQDQCELHIPYIHQKPHWDLSVNLSVQTPIFWLTAINSLISSSPSISLSVPYEIFVQMEDISVYGIQPQTTPTTVFKSRRTSYSTFVSDSRKDKEAEAKDMVGMAAKGAIQLVKPIISSIPFAPQIITMGKFLFGNLDKPSSQQAATITMERGHRAHALLKGEDFTEPLSQEPSFNVSQEVNMTTSAMGVTQYAQKPALYNQYTVTAPGTVDTFSAHPMVYLNAVRTEPDFLAFASSFYSYWRGSIKYMFHFVGTPFYSARFKISVATTPNIPASTTLSGGTGYYSRIIDVKGDAFTSITVPYLNPQVWGMMQNTNDCSFLIIELLSPIQGSSLPASALYYVNVFRAAANDFQLSFLTKSQNYPSLTETDESRIFTGFESDTSLDGKFAETSEGITTANHGFTEHGLFMADTAGSISDSLKRYVQHTPIPLFGQSYPNTPITAPTIFSPFHFWQFGFCYWRGSRRIKNTAVVSGLMPTISLVDPTGNTTTSGHALAISYSNTTTGFQAVTVPWYSPDMFFLCGGVQTNSNTSPIDTFNSNLTDFPLTWISAGDDFCYLMVRPPIIAGITILQKRAQRAKVPQLPMNVLRSPVIISSKKL